MGRLLKWFFDVSKCNFYDLVVDVNVNRNGFSILMVVGGVKFWWWVSYGLKLKWIWDSW